MRCEFSAYVIVGKCLVKTERKRGREERNADHPVDQHYCDKCETSNPSNVSHKNITVEHQEDWVCPYEM